MKISMIVACDRNRGIGKNNELPWRLPADLKHFKQTTYGHHMLMGRKTFDSIGKPLPGRTSIVLTRNRDRSFPEGVLAVESLEEGIALAQQAGEEELFIVGGGELYRLAMEKTETIYLTEVETDAQADTFFPQMGQEWEEVERVSFGPDEKNAYAYHFVTLQRQHTERL